MDRVVYWLGETTSLGDKPALWWWEAACYIGE
jgi:hypothetical protein